MDESTAQQAARTFIAPLDVSGICSDLSPYAEAANAVLKFHPLNEGECGFTVTKPNGRHVITVNGLEREERQRFTICHEIGHLVLSLPSRHDELPSWSFAKRDPNEVWCDVFAAELLMPYRQFKARIPVGEPDAAVIERLAAEFRTSYPAAASRYATLTDLPCAFVTMQGGLVRYAARSTALRKARGWITPRTPIPVGTIAHRLRAAGKSALDSGDVAQDIWLEKWDSDGDLSEIARHYSRFDTTLSLLWFLPEDLPEVEIDRFGRPIYEDAGLPELTGELKWPGKSRRK